MSDLRHDTEVREQIVELARDMLDTLEDPTQAWDIAVADFNYEIGLLVEASREDA